MKYQVVNKSRKGFRYVELVSKEGFVVAYRYRNEETKVSDSWVDPNHGDAAYELVKAYALA